MTSSIRLERTVRTAPIGRSWAQRFAFRLVVTDVLAVLIAILVGGVAWYDDGAIRAGAPIGEVAIAYPPLSVLVILIWLGALAVVDSRDHREIGAGITEYRRVIEATAITFGLVLVMSFFLGVDLSRLWVCTVFGTGLVALVGARWGWRRWLVGRRVAGGFSHRVVLVGSSETVAGTARDLARQPGHGYHVVGVAVTDGPTAGTVAGLPIVGAVDDVPHLLGALGADTVIATSSDDLPPERIRDLSWHLEPGRHHLAVAPSLTDVAGSRIHLRPVAGLPLIHVETPHYRGAGRYGKRAFDVVVAGAILLVLAPLLAVVSVLVHRSGPGGVFYSQERIGRDGEPFRILKFRSMVPNAEALLAQLRDPSAGKGLFKMADDPRVTPIGKVLRRYSIDELPQLFNVLRGEMSLVGPRPALPTEVSEYDRRELRRLAVTPGLSGLWQVSGRSNLGWSDGIRLDLYYVENWSMTQDLSILWRTARAVLKSEGAY